MTRRPEWGVFFLPVGRLRAGNYPEQGSIAILVSIFMWHYGIFALDNATPGIDRDPRDITRMIVNRSHKFVD